MNTKSSKFSVYIALGANLLIATTKFIAGAFTNSSSMISEAIHSLVDTTNQGLLLFGIHRSKKPADKDHPFGYGKELYFWSFIVAILIFGLGGGLSIYQGILHIRHPEPIDDPTWNYIVLSLAMVFEGIALYIAAKVFNKVRGELSTWAAIMHSKDPASFLVLAEDAAAVGGLLIVLICMFINQTFNIPVLDGVASLLVGLLLVFVSFILARESRSLLMGEGIAPDVKKRIKDLVERDGSVTCVKSMISTYQSPEEVVLMLLVDFKNDLNTGEITDAIGRLRNAITAEFSLVQYIFIQPE